MLNLARLAALLIKIEQMVRAIFQDGLSLKIFQELVATSEVGGKLACGG